MTALRELLAVGEIGHTARMQIRVNDETINVALEGTNLKLIFDRDFKDEEGHPVKLGIAVASEGQFAIAREVILHLTAPPVHDPSTVRFRLHQNDSWRKGPSDVELLRLVDGMQIEVTSTRS